MVPLPMAVRHELVQGAGTGALIRGGNFANGSLTGVFAVDGLITPSIADTDVGFRAAR
jgi:hypothetical protein